MTRGGLIRIDLSTVAMTTRTWSRPQLPAGVGSATVVLNPVSMALGGTRGAAGGPGTAATAESEGYHTSPLHSLQAQEFQELAIQRR